MTARLKRVESFSRNVRNLKEHRSPREPGLFDICQKEQQREYPLTRKESQTTETLILTDCFAEKTY